MQMTSLVAEEKPRKQTCCSALGQGTCPQWKEQDREHQGPGTIVRQEEEGARILWILFFRSVCLLAWREAGVRARVKQGVEGVMGNTDGDVTLYPLWQFIFPSVLEPRKSQRDRHRLIYQKSRGDKACLLGRDLL